MDVIAQLEFNLAYDDILQHFSYFVIKVKIVTQVDGDPEGSLFHIYNTEVYRRALLHFLDRSTLTLILTLKCWILSKVASSTLFGVFGMNWPGIEPRSPGQLERTLHIRPMARPIIKTYVQNQAKFSK